LRAPIPQILLAFEGKWDMLIKSNPFGSSQKPDAKAAKKEKQLQSFRSNLSMMKIEMRQKRQEKKSG
jgi:hypothetical protein